MTDSRRFHYPLDIQLQRLRWRLDEQLAALATAQAAVARVRERRDTSATDISQQAHSMAQAQAERVDPMRAARSIHYLADLHRRHLAVEREFADAERLVSEGREQLTATQVEIDKLERDRDECWREHLRENERQAQCQADQDWSAQGAWQARAMAAPEERR